MLSLPRFLALAGIFALCSFAWLTLGGTTSNRTFSQRDGLGGEVAELWGTPQTQAAPAVVCRRVVRRTETRREVIDGTERQVTRDVEDVVEEVGTWSASDLDVALHLDRRRRGLVWYPLYTVAFTGTFEYVHTGAPCELVVRFAFPDQGGLYDDFRFVIDGTDVSASTHPIAGQVAFPMEATTGQRVAVQVAYRSRGMGEWRYQPVATVATLSRFALRMRTDFADIDFPSGTLSPTARRREGTGHVLAWRFDRVVTGRGMGMVAPTPIQPGELAAELAFSAPVSLLFFFVVLEALGLRRRIDLHPMHFVFLSAAFFAFHLLFSYSADRLPVEVAFALASLVSLFLVVTYLGRVVSPRFALLEAGLAHLVYLVGFSLAHFAQGTTGLAITILSILTLFALMQWTAHVKWGREPAASA